MTKFVKKTAVLFMALTLVTLTSCGEVKEENVGTGIEAEPLADTVADTDLTGSEDENDDDDFLPDSVRIQMDNNALHEGVIFTDKELIKKINDFYNTVTENYTPSDTEPEGETLYGGSWMYLTLERKRPILIEFKAVTNPDGSEEHVPYVGINGYYTDVAEVDDLHSEVLDYLSANGYWG